MIVPKAAARDGRRLGRRRSFRHMRSRWHSPPAPL